MNYPHTQWVSGAISNTCPTLLLTSCYQHNKHSHVVTQTATAFPEREPVEKMGSQHAAHCSTNHSFHAQLNTTIQTSVGLVCRYVPCMKDPMKLVWPEATPSLYQYQPGRDVEQYQLCTDFNTRYNKSQKSVCDPITGPGW